MKILLAALLLAASGVSVAQSTPVGLWKTIDDETKKENSYVRIVADAAGVLTGRIEKLIDPDKPDPKCDKCSGARKDQPIMGMVIIENTRKDDTANHWEDGTILDPNNGKTYRLRLTPKEGGKSLEVRGYLGPFYRNQTWLRVE
jgi:uncharacterized protein (DUF2147 family)